MFPVKTENQPIEYQRKAANIPALKPYNYDEIYEGAQANKHNQSFHKKLIAIDQQIPAFHRTLRNTGLESSYKISNPEYQISGNNYGGSKGVEFRYDNGVITNFSNILKQSPDGSFYLAFPEFENKKLLFTQDDFNQIMNELTMGIYMYDAVPFFSLEIAENSNGSEYMYPVVHPVYRDTYVGKIIGELDHFMKAYLHGGYFPDDSKWVAKNKQVKGQQKQQRSLKEQVDQLKADQASERKYYLKKIDDLQVKQKKLARIIDEKKIPLEQLRSEITAFGRRVKKAEQNIDRYSQTSVNSFNAMVNQYDNMVSEQKQRFNEVDSFVNEANSINPEIKSYQQKINNLTSKYNALVAKTNQSVRESKSLWGTSKSSLKKLGYLDFHENNPSFRSLVEKEHALGVPSVRMRRDSGGREYNDIIYNASFRIIGEQDSVRNYKNMFVIDGDYYVEHHDGDLKWTPKAERLYTSSQKKEERSVLKSMSKEIESQMGHKSEKIRKYLELLELISFMTYFLKSLKSEGRMPILNASNHNVEYKMPATFVGLPSDVEKNGKFYAVGGCGLKTENLRSANDSSFKEYFDQKVDSHAITPPVSSSLKSKKEDISYFEYSLNYFNNLKEELLEKYWYDKKSPSVTPLDKVTANSSKRDIPMIKLSTVPVSAESREDYAWMFDGIVGFSNKIIKVTQIIKEAQELLNRLGYDVGTPDGISGTMTKKAIRKFQTDNNMYIDGKLTKVMFELLEQQALLTVY